MIEWQDKSDARSMRYVYDAGALTVDLVRAHAGEMWFASIGCMDGRTWITRSHNLDALLCADDAKARALALAKPIADAISERSAEVARAIAVAVAGARLDAVV